MGQVALMLLTAAVTLAAVWTGAWIASRRTAALESRFARLFDAAEAESRRKTDLLLAADPHTFGMLRTTDPTAPPLVMPAGVGEDDWTAGEVTYVDPHDIPVPDRG